MKKNDKQMKKISKEVIKDNNEDTATVAKLIFILVGVSLVTVLLYFASSKFIIKDGVEKEEEKPAVEIAYDSVNVGNVFNRPYNEYYILAYDANSLKASYYSALLNTFDVEDSKIYFLDLSKDINKKYIGEEVNKNASKPSELVLKEPTLLKIKNGKISKVLTTIDEIEKEI